MQVLIKNMEHNSGSEKMFGAPQQWKQKPHTQHLSEINTFHSAVAIEGKPAIGRNLVFSLMFS